MNDNTNKKTEGSISNSKQLLSINNYLSNPNQQYKITSPRSLQAIRQLGYIQEDFHYIPFRHFLSMRQDIRQLAPEIQKNRYQTYEHIRITRIKEVAELRDTLDPNQYNSTTTKSKTIQTNNELLSETEIKSTAVAEEMKAFERMKRKNEADLVNMVEYELQKQIIRKEAEQRMRKQQFKIEQFQKEIKLKQEQDALLQKDRQEKKLQHDLEEEERQRQINTLRYLQDQEKLKKQMADEKDQLRLNRLKHEEDERKRLEFQQKIDDMLEEKQRYANEKRALMDQKDEERKAALENHRIKVMKESSEKARLKQELISRNLDNLNEHLKAVRQKYLKKQQENDIKKQRLDQQKEQELKEKQEEARIRAENTKNVLDKDRAIQQKKLDDYNQKQQMIEMKKSIIEKQKMKENEEQERELEERKQHRLNTIIRNNEILYERNEKIKAKMAYKDAMTQKTQTQREREHTEKCEELNIKRTLRYNNRKRIEHFQQNHREDTLNWILDKANRIQSYKNQKEMISDHKRQLKDSIARKKEEYESKFQLIFHKKEIDNKTIDTIHQMFPNNETINTLLGRLDDIEKENQVQNTIEKEYEDNMQKSQNEFKKSLKNDSNNNTLKKSYTSESKAKKNSRPLEDDAQYETQVTTNQNQTKLQSKGNVHYKKAINKEPYKESISTIPNETIKTNQTIYSTTKKDMIISMNQSNQSLQVTFNHQGNVKSPHSNEERETSNSDVAIQSVSQFKNTNSKDKDKDKGIIKRINKYKTILSNELLALISQEKKLEEKRVQEYIKAQDQEKEEIEKRISKERALSSLRIINKNDEIEEKLKQYENKLCNNNNNNNNNSTKS